jgi:hypothetical protein
MLSLSRLQLAAETMAKTLDALRGRGPMRLRVEERLFPAFDGGCLGLKVPAIWREELVLEDGLTTLLFRADAHGPSERPAVVTLSLRPLTPQACLDFSIEQMRCDVEEAARAEGGGPLEVFAGRYGGGFYFESGNEVQGRFLARPVVVSFLIEGSLRRAALELVRSARAIAAA